MPVPYKNSGDSHENPKTHSSPHRRRFSRRCRTIDHNHQPRGRINHYRIALRQPQIVIRQCLKEKRPRYQERRRQSQKRFSLDRTKNQRRFHQKLIIPCLFLKGRISSALFCSQIIFDDLPVVKGIGTAQKLVVRDNRQTFGIVAEFGVSMTLGDEHR